MIRYERLELNSVVDGEGIRTAVFLRGCTHDCPGCQNKFLQPFEGGNLVTEEELCREILKTFPKAKVQKNVTFSGGDPMCQPAPLEKVIKLLKEAEPDINIWIYTGFLFEEIKHFGVIPFIDVIVDGPFIENKRDSLLPFRGSSNQRLINVKESLQTDSVIHYRLHG